VVALLLALLNLATASGAADELRASFINAKGEEIGTAILTESEGVKVRLDIRRLPPGRRAFHAHENGRCDPPGFESAGDHFSPDGNEHGFLAKGGPHAGDFENIEVREDGTLKAELINKRITLGKGKNSLRKKGGTSLVIHESTDDYKSQPSGDAGGRIACAVIK
jgi:superoxide dismutase, Cu-Zn family